MIGRSGQCYMGYGNRANSDIGLAAIFYADALHEIAFHASHIVKRKPRHDLPGHNVYGIGWIFQGTLASTGRSAAVFCSRFAKTT